MLEFRNPLVTTVVEAAVRRLLDEPESASAAFNWGSSLLADSLLRVQRLDGKVRTAVRTWADRGFAVGGGPRDLGGSLWKMGAGAVFTGLAVEHGTTDSVWLDRLCLWLDHLADIPCMASGIWSSKWDKRQVWVDSLMTLVPTLLASSSVLRRPEYAGQAVDLCLRSADVLQDPETGLWWHAWDEESAEPLGTWWCRGNAWALMALVQVATTVPTTMTGMTELRQRLCAQIAGLLSCQRVDGSWGTVLDDPCSDMESSGQALLAVWMLHAAQSGVGSKVVESSARRAWGIVSPCIDAQGVLTGVSLGTGLGDAAAYRAVKTAGWPMWGYAAAVQGVLAFEE